MGMSSPIVVDGRVFLSGYEDEQRTLTCYNLADGKLLWRRTLSATRREEFYEANGPASPTPTADSHRVVVLFPEIGLIAYTHDGEQSWRVPLGPFSSMYGIAASPVIVGDHVIVVIDQSVDSSVAAYALTDGRAVWRRKLETNGYSGYATPALVRREGGSHRLLLSVSGGALLVDAGSGEVIWRMEGLPPFAISSSAVSGDQAFVQSYGAGGTRPESFDDLDWDGDGRLTPEDFDGPIIKWPESMGNRDGVLTREEFERVSDLAHSRPPGLFALPLDHQGEMLPQDVTWSFGRGIPIVQSPLAYDGLVYVLRDGGIFTVLDQRTGKQVRKGRIRDAPGHYWASPVAGDGKIYIASSEGDLTVLKAGRRWEILSQLELGEAIYATPALADGRLVVRTDYSLICMK